MPAERINVTFEPRPLELLYSKYATSNNINNTNKLITTTTSSASSSSPFIKPTLTNAITNKPKTGVANNRRNRPDAPPWINKGEELGDLRKLGRELTKIERVQMLLDMSANPAPKKCRNGSRSTTSSAEAEVTCLKTQCRQCSKEHKREEGQSKLRNLKSKLRLVAARSLPDCCRQPPHQQQQQSSSSISSTSPVRHSSQRVVPLPLLQLSYQRNASSVEDLAALKEARQSLRHMLYPQPYVSRRAAAIWNYRFGDKPAQPPRGRDVVYKGEYRGEYCDSSDGSSQLMLFQPAVVPPACSPAEDHQYDTESVSTFDADRLDSQQFEYIFERFSVSSSESSEVTTLSHESDTATVSARAQRPSTTDTVATQQRLVETRASMAPPMSPVSPRQRARGSVPELWPPQYTVVPSWPSVDDPYRFQYFGCGVHRDIMRRLHRSRGKRSHRTKQQQPQQQQPQPQKLKVVVPTQAECLLCDSAVCQHSSRTTTAAQSQTHTASTTGKSAKSRDSLAMSVCTVLSRKANKTTSMHNGAGSLSGKDKAASDFSADAGGLGRRAVSLDRGISESVNRRKRRSLDRPQPLSVTHGSKKQPQGVFS